MRIVSGPKKASCVAAVIGAALLGLLVHFFWADAIEAAYGLRPVVSTVVATLLGAASGDWFGRSVSISGHEAVVVAPGACQGYG